MSIMGGHIEDTRRTHAPGVFCKYGSSSSSYLAAHDTGHGLPSRVMFGKHTADNINTGFRTQRAARYYLHRAVLNCAGESWLGLGCHILTLLGFDILPSAPPALGTRHQLCLHRGNTPPPPGTPLVGRGSRVVREERSDIEFRRHAIL